MDAQSSLFLLFFSFTLQPVRRKVSSGVLRNADPEAHKCTLFVGQLNYTFKATAVLEHFSKYGKVTGLTMPRHPRNEGQSKGFALVEFDTTVAFLKALKAKQHKVRTLGFGVFYMMV